MNRTDRLLAIILELQAKGWQRAEDLAATFEVTKRTIYRDMLALLESGVPIISVPGQGYSLVEGYFLPPIRFSTDEALLLLLGANFAAQNFDAQYRLAARAAERKIRAILPDPFRQEVDTLQDSIRLIANPSSATHQEVLQALRRAIIQSRRVQFSYHARFGEAASPREADPSDRTLGVRILVRPAAIRWMRENPSFFQTDAAEQPDGLLVTLHVRHEEEVLQWLLGWGANVLVLEPASLRRRIIAEAEATLRQYPPDPAEL